MVSTVVFVTHTFNLNALYDDLLVFTIFRMKYCDFLLLALSDVHFTIDVLYLKKFITL